MVRFLLLFCAAIICPGTARASDADLLQDLLFTKDTLLESKDRPGVRFIRRYDAKGALEYLESIDEGANRHRIFEVRDGGRVREIRYLQGRTVIRKETENYAEPDVLATRTVELSDRKIVETFAPFRVWRRTYQLKGAQWILATEVEGDPVLFAGGNNPANVGTGEFDWRRSGAEKWEQYLSCRVEAGTLQVGDVAACRSYYLNRESAFIQSKSLDLRQIATPYCKDSEQVFLPNLYRLDRESCDKPEAGAHPNALGLLARATQLVTGKYLSCLSDLNPGYARQFVESLAERRIRINCAGTDGGRDRVAEHWCTSDTKLAGTYAPDAMDSCLKDTKRSYFGAAAFFTREYPNDITLKREDPNRPGARQGDKFYPFLTEQEQVSSMAASIFHESLHAANHHGYHHHNQRNFPQLDDIFGCEGVCTTRVAPEVGVPTIAMHTTQQGCLACMRAGETTDEDLPDNVEETAVPLTDAETRLCGGYPPAERMRELVSDYSLVIQLATCQAEVRKLAARSVGNGNLAAIRVNLGTNAWKYYSTAATWYAPGCNAFTCNGCSYLASQPEFLKFCKADSSDFLDCTEKAAAAFRKRYAATSERLGKDFSTMSRQLRSLAEGLRIRVRMEKNSTD